MRRLLVLMTVVAAAGGCAAQQHAAGAPASRSAGPAATPSPAPDAVIPPDLAGTDRVPAPVERALGVSVRATRRVEHARFYPPPCSGPDPDRGAPALTQVGWISAL